VRDVERSAAFYRDVLGFRQVWADAPSRFPVAAFSSGRTHHELLLIEVGADAAAQPAGRRLGLYHFGLKVGDSDDELRTVLKELQANDVTIVGASDHTVTHSLYIEDPDGNEIELVPSGQRGVNQIEIQIGVTDEAAFEKFYGDALGAERLSAGRFKLGETIFSFQRDAAAVRAPKSPPGSAMDALATMRAVGMRYVTVQVRDCDGEHRRLMSMGVWEGAAPVTLGAVARISFIRDPDGNFIEISQRASLTGPIPGQAA
jgi:catechol-2,3-dioxygenase